MQVEDDINFLFDISKQVKAFYETAVIYFTKKDYSHGVFNILCSIRSPLRNGDKSKIIDCIVEFHLQWLHAVNEISNFRKRINIGLPREEIFETLSYTIDAMSNRLKYYQIYVEAHRSGLPNPAQINLMADLEIVEEMHKENYNVLVDKLKCFRTYVDDHEFRLKLEEEIENLLFWVDKIYDGIAMNLSKYVNVNVPHLGVDLTKTLQEIVDEIQYSTSPTARLLLDELREKGKEISSLVRCTAGHDLEICKVVEKINTLDERIKRMEHEPFSAAITALKHKRDFLEETLNSLGNLKTTIKSLHELTNVPIEDDDICVCKDFFQFKIFNHFLPPEERERLVTELCYQWDTAVYGDQSHKSIISILSAADIREEFEDQLGRFFVDEYSRKIYRKSEDNILYQANQNNVLVPVGDDPDHIYFYDECGRYFVDKTTKQRIYKDHESASEYMLDASGVLLKIKEERDGVTYYYDNYGRYHINSEGKHIYRDADAVSQYENDELGNLVRKRSQLDIFQPCPDDAHVTEEFNYLKQAVGPALCKCIAEVVVLQPADPIKYLSTSLLKYRENIELKQRRARETEELMVEREIILSEKRAADERAALEAALLAQGGSEASYDSNLLKYTSFLPKHEDDVVSVGASTK